MAILGSKNIKEFVGEVISDKTSQTRIVLVKTVQMHPLYKKRFIVKKKYYVHDEANKSKLGDTVRIRESKPISKLKRWTLIAVQ
ncbi:MAG: 30S ribosomal protein S17 [candidate division SR1 bacterium CG_4_9_14_3_um_filter_40_9]|nr:MAG: 30S ribosomal protein S17 [candidate division SR1 bacterium CG_4_9_14_3_um_filter_40_9]